jgi:hypothetical protein
MVNKQLCTQVTLQCPVEATTLGYYPNLGVNIFFCVVYAICAFVTVTIGVWKRTWAFGLVVSAGLVLEATGECDLDCTVPISCLWKRSYLYRCRATNDVDGVEQATPGASSCIPTLGARRDLRWI